MHVEAQWTERSRETATGRSQSGKSWHIYCFSPTYALNPNPLPSPAMSTRKLKGKRKNKNNEHIEATTSFEDPYVRKRTFTETYASASRATTHSEQNSINVGRESVRKRIRVDSHLPAEDKCKETGSAAKEKTRVRFY